MTEYIKANKSLIMDRVNGLVDETGDKKLKDMSSNLYFTLFLDSYHKSMEILYDIASYIGCSLDYLLGRSDVFSLL